MADPSPLAGSIARIRAGEHLAREEMHRAFEAIMTGRTAEPDMAEFLLALAEKGETVEEIAGAADVMNEKVTRVPCDAECVDTCGTGGDGISTFNVSTTAAIIAAAAGAVVAKHGNRTNTRVSGSAEAAALLGINLEADVPVLARCLRECGIAFLYAPRLHPAMKYAAPVRRQVAVRTIFNLLGPLTNPAGARRQVLGTCSAPLTDTLARVLALREARLAWVVHGSDGLCDLTITGPSRVVESRDGSVRVFEVHPDRMGLAIAPLTALLVDSPQASAAAILAILRGEDRGPRRSHALLNAGAVLTVAGLAEDLAEGVARAAAALDSGRATEKLEHLKTASHS